MTHNREWDLRLGTVKMPLNNYNFIQSLKQTCNCYSNKTVPIGKLCPQSHLFVCSNYKRAHYIPACSCCEVVGMCGLWLTCKLWNKLEMLLHGAIINSICTTPIMYYVMHICVLSLFLNIWYPVWLIGAPMAMADMHMVWHTVSSKYKRWWLFILLLIKWWP